MPLSKASKFSASRKRALARVCFLAACFLAGGIVATAHRVMAQSPEPAPSVKVASPTKAASQKDPLEKLKRRSALDRWKALSKGWSRREKTAAKPVARNNRPEKPAGPQMLPQSTVPQVKPVQTATNKPKQPVRRLRPRLSSGSLASPPASEIFYRTARNNVLKETRPAKTDNNKIKKITEINPFADYEPDSEIAASDACRNQCPRPDGTCAKEGTKGHFTVCPETERLTGKEYQRRQIPASLFAWEAPNLYHNPLYFEDPQLERYGHTYNEAIQPFVSVGKFGVQLVGLPYQMAIDPIHKKKYVLGWYRPGECAPKKHYRIPWNTKAAAVQAGATAGGILLVP